MAKPLNFGHRFRSKEEFYKRRNIQLSNLPPSTEGEIREFLNVFRAKKIKISETLDSALVTLENGERLEEAVEKLNNKMFKDNLVAVTPGCSGQVLCIAHFPLSYTEDMFRVMCERYGAVEYAYIMRSEATGDSKGYGLVEYSTDLEQVKLIKSELDWKSVDGQTLHADILDEVCLLNYDGLKSRCLLISNMPEDFVDVSRLRDMFGCVTSPVYCQIIAKGERSLGCGIVEFRTAEDAEETWLKMQKEKIGDKEIVITFCIPGKSAVIINNRIMWKFGDRLQKSSSLLPDPVSAKPVIAGNPIVMSLTKLNPLLMDEFTKVLGELQQAYVSQMMSPVNKPGLLGPAPSLPLSPMMNPNMQLGLLVMLAIYIQGAKKEQFYGVLAKQLNTLSEQDNTGIGPKPSILGDPMTGQANVILTSLKQQLNQVQLNGDDGKEIVEPEGRNEKIAYIVKKFVANGRFLNLSLLTNLGQLLVTMKQVSNEPVNPVNPVNRSVVGIGGGKGQSLLGPMPGVNLSNPQPLMTPPMGGKGNSLLGDAPNASPKSLLGIGGSSSGGGVGVNNAAIMQAMGLNVGSGNNSGAMGQTLLSQISQGLVHQIGQNLMYQMTMNQSGSQGSGAGGGRGLLGDVPSDVNNMGGNTMGTNNMAGNNMAGNNMGTGNMAGNNMGVGNMTGNNMGTGNMGTGSMGTGSMGTGNMGINQQRMKGSMNSGAGGGNKASLLGEAPSNFKGVQNTATGGTSLDQGTWKSMESNRWGSGNNYESGYGSKGGMGGGYNDYGYTGNESYSQDMSGMTSGYGGYGDGSSDYYNYQQHYGYGVQDNFQTDSGYSQFGSGFGSGGGMGSSGTGNMSRGGSGGASYGMGGGLGGNQASGVSFQDGQAFGKGGSSGLGQDSGSYGVGGYGSGMGSASYEYGGRDDMSGAYDSYGSVSMGGNYGMGDGMGAGGMNGMGTGSMSGMGGGSMSGMGSGSMTGMGGTSMSGMTGGTMSGMGSGGMSGMGSGSMSGMGSGGMSGMGSGGMSGMGGSGMSGMGSGMSGMGSSGMSGMGSGGMSGMGSGGMSGMGSGGMSGMGSSGMSGMGSGGMSGMGSGGMSGMGSSGMSGMGSGMSGMGSSGMGGSGMSGMGSSSMSGMGGGSMSGMGSNSMSGMGMGGMGSSGMSGMGGGMGGGSMGSSGLGMNNGMGEMLTSSYSTSLSGMGSRSSMSGMAGTSSGVLGSKMGGMSGRDQGLMSGSYYQTAGASSLSSSGLLPSPSKQYVTPGGQKRSHSQLLPKPEASPDGADYIGQHSQGLGGHYVDSYKRSRLY